MDPIIQMSGTPRTLADELESGNGNVRYCCVVWCCEEVKGPLLAGHSMRRVLRDNADPAEVAEILEEAGRRIGRQIVTVD